MNIDFEKVGDAAEQVLQTAWCADYPLCYKDSLEQAGTAAFNELMRQICGPDCTACVMMADRCGMAVIRDVQTEKCSYVWPGPSCPACKVKVLEDKARSVKHG